VYAGYVSGHEDQDSRSIGGRCIHHSTGSEGMISTVHTSGTKALWIVDDTATAITSLDPDVYVFHYTVRPEYEIYLIDEWQESYRPDHAPTIYKNQMGAGQIEIRQWPFWFGTSGRLAAVSA
jgi:hypothetical protein